jgi:glycine betaine/proline transport system substrate-binding protein
MARLKLIAAAVALAAGGLVMAPGVGLATECGTDRTIDIAEMSWPSAAALAQIHAVILERGFGCTVELVTGDTVPTLASMSARGAPAFAPELWPNASQEVWDGAVADGTVIDMGPAITEGLVQGWYIPTYLAEANPDLKHVDDLPAHKALFADPDDASKGRFVSCPPGWSCEIMDANFFKAYGLEESFNIFSPGSGGALDATISRAFLREEPIVFYYWGPTAMMGRYDMTRLEMDAFDADKFACIGRADCENPERTDFVVPEALKAAASWLPEEAPEVAAYLNTAELSTAEVGRMLAWGEENSADAEATALHFLAEEPEVWTRWVPQDVADAVRNSL